MGVVQMWIQIRDGSDVDVGAFGSDVWGEEGRYIKAERSKSGDVEDEDVLRLYHLGRMRSCRSVVGKQMQMLCRWKS